MTALSSNARFALSRLVAFGRSTAREIAADSRWGDRPCDLSLAEVRAALAELVAAGFALEDASFVACQQSGVASREPTREEIAFFDVPLGPDSNISAASSIVASLWNAGIGPQDPLYGKRSRELERRCRELVERIPPVDQKARALRAAEDLGSRVDPVDFPELLRTLLEEIEISDILAVDDEAFGSAATRELRDCLDDRFLVGCDR